MNGVRPLQWVLFGAAVAVAACSKTPEPPSRKSESSTPTAAPSAAHATAPSASAAFDMRSMIVVWDEPKRWSKAPESKPPRLATYTVPKAKKDRDDAEVTVFHFGPGSGGDIESNVSRWTSQFEDVPKEKVRRVERKINGLSQHIVEIDKGTFSSGMPGGPKTPKKDYALIAAIVESPGGNYFFKMTGPAATVKSARGEMYTLLGTTRPGPH